MSTADGVPSPFFHLFQSMAQRFDFAPGKFLLQHNALPVSIGWESTIKRADIAAMARPDRNTLYKKLVTAFSEHTLVGEKAVMYFGFSGLPTSEKLANKASVELALSSLQIPDSSFKSAYPLAVYDQAELKQFDSNTSILTAIFAQNERVFFLFSSVRAFNERVPIDRGDFEQIDKDRLADYSELIGVRAIRRQCFDYVVYDFERELVELRIDCPDGMPQVQKISAMHALIASFNGLSVFPSGWSPFNDNPYNFHSLMGNLYKANSEGTVFQLGFTASTDKTSSNNGARLLRKKNFDLRKDEFHIGGAQKVKDISVYTIGVEWQAEVGLSNPILIVPGTAKMLYSPPITFPELYIRGCANSAQYEMLTKKIDKYRR